MPTIISGRTLHPEEGPLTIGWARFQIFSHKGLRCAHTTGKVLLHSYCFFFCNVLRMKLRWEAPPGVGPKSENNITTISTRCTLILNIQLYPVWTLVRPWLFMNCNMADIQDRQVSRIWIIETVPWLRKWKRCLTSGCWRALMGSVLFHITCHTPVESPQSSHLPGQISHLHKSCTKHTHD